jgi:putative aldouronate transport system substrate-binding protein
MKKLKIFLALGMAVVAVLVGGCKKASVSASGGAQASANTSAKQEHPAKIDSGYVLPVFDPPQKFTIFWRLNPKATATITDYAEMTLFQEYKKRFGFDFEFIHPPLDRHTEQFNLMRASGDFPDFVYWEDWTNVANGLDSIFLEGLAMELNPYMTQHNAPNFTKLLEEPLIRKAVTSDSGKFYGFPLLRYKLPMKCVWGFMVREDWVEKVGMKVSDIQTVDDLYKLLTLFKTGNVNGDGKTVYPWMAKKTELHHAMKMWGIGNGFFQKNGKVAFGFYEPEYRDVITTLAKWYKEGLIDPDYSTADVKTGDALMLNNTSGFYYGETGGISIMYMTTWKDTNPTAKVVGIPYPTATKDGIHYTTEFDELYNGVALAISKNNKFPVESVRFMDWGYSKEGGLLQNWGPEGITYTMVNGKPKFTDIVVNNPNNLSIDNVIARHALGSMQGPYLSDSDIREQRMLFHDWQRESVKAWNAQTDIRMPRVTLIPEESRRYGQLMGDINTYRDEMFDKFVMGKEPLANLNAYYDTLKRMGIEEAIAIQQAALDRFNAR